MTWKQLIVSSAAEDSVFVEVVNDIMPSPGALGYGTVLRSLRSEFIDTWKPRRDEARKQAETLLAQLVDLTKQGRIGEAFPAAGQSAGLIQDIVPAAEVVRRLVEEAAIAIEGAKRFT
jgi:nitronate monooxygenase/enoyl-[acyl-carrier protein] reductase II